MKKDDRVYLHHIVDAIQRVQEYTVGISQDEFLQNHVLQDAVVRQIEIVGEAARNVSDEYQDAHPELPWGKMIGIRNKIIHEYFQVNFVVDWRTAQDDLPPLKRQVQTILGE